MIEGSSKDEEGISNDGKKEISLTNDLIFYYSIALERISNFVNSFNILPESLWKC